MELPIGKIVKGIARTYGKEFFEQIALQLDRVIGSDYTFIARIDENRAVSKTIALVAFGKLIDNFEYHLADTPCKDVSDDSVCYFPKDVTRYFPDDQLLIDMNIEGYLGAPLHDSEGKVMGIVVGLYENEIKDKSFTLSLFELFSGRIAAEFERTDKEIELLALNTVLDKKSKKRAEELALAITDLQNTRKKLVEAEKMAALGDLVAGVAHEVNTPLGVAITAESYLVEMFSDFKHKLEDGHLTKTDMSKFVASIDQSLPMITRNLTRSKQIIDNFKRMATDQIELSAEQVSLSSYYERLLSTLKPIFKRKKVALVFSGCENDQLMTFPGCHAQLLTNLITNSVQHGFTEHAADNVISVNIHKDTKHNFVVDYIDNGCGISTTLMEKVLEPFFTTARQQGNSGLGLSIVYNLVHQNLGGTFEVLTADNGAHFRYQFKSA